MSRPPAENAPAETASAGNASADDAPAPTSIADPSGYGDPSVGAGLARRLAESLSSGVGRAVDEAGTRFVVGTVDEIPPGSRKVVVIEGREIGVFNVDGEYFAVLNRCPHQGGPLCSGRQTGFLRSPTPGEFELSRPGEVIRCPWHGWEFDLRTGQSWCEPSRVRVRSYEVTVQPGAAIVPAGPGPCGSDAPGPCGSGAPEPASEPGMEGLVKGPYVAETYPVAVERQYVVVELSGRR